MNGITRAYVQSQLSLVLEKGKVPNLGRDVTSLGRDLTREIYSFAIGNNSELHLINKQSYLMVKGFHKEFFQKVKAAFIAKDIETLKKIKQILFNYHFFYALHYTVKSLIETKCDVVRFQGRDGNLLSKAIGDGDLKRVQVAIELGVGVHSAAMNSNFDIGFHHTTPLTGSILCQQFNIATYFLMKGADPTFDRINLGYWINTYFIVAHPFPRMCDNDHNSDFFLAKCDFISGLKCGIKHEDDDQKKQLEKVFERTISKSTAADLIYQSAFKGYSSVTNGNQFIHSIFSLNDTGEIILTYLDPKREVFSEDNPTISLQDYYRRLFEMKYEIPMPFLRFFEST